MDKRQAVSKAYIKDFINDWHDTAATITSRSPAAVEDLMDKFFAPSSSPPSSAYLNKFPEAFRAFVIEFFEFAVAIAAISTENKVAILRELFHGTLVDRSVKRDMRHGLRNRQGEDGLPDEGIKLDDAQKLGATLDEVFGPFGSLDPLELSHQDSGVWHLQAEDDYPEYGSDDAGYWSDDSDADQADYDGYEVVDSGAGHSTHNHTDELVDADS
jgi:hypothetical protein